MSSPAATRSRPTRPAAPPRAGRRGAWAYALRTATPPPGRDPRTLDVVTKWLVAIRAGVLPMTLGAGLVAGLLAVRAEGFSWSLYLLALLGIVLAHICSTLMGHLSDTDAGFGTGASPILSGMLRRRSLGLAVIGLHLAGLAITGVLALQRGWPVVAFAAAGLVLAVADASPTLRRERRGLGELGVLVTWGPLMIAGTCFCAVGSLPWQVWLASVPYGLLCASVLMGRHLDEIPDDAATGTRTLPVVLGDARARAATIRLLVASYAASGLAVAVGALPWPVLLVALALPRLRAVSSALRAPRPDEPPPGPPLPGPPPSAAVMSAHARRAGSLLVLGLGLAAAFEVGLPLGG